GAASRAGSADHVAAGSGVVGALSRGAGAHAARGHRTGAAGAAARERARCLCGGHAGAGDGRDGPAAMITLGHATYDLLAGYVALAGFAALWRVVRAARRLRRGHGALPATALPPMHAAFEQPFSVLV